MTQSRAERLVARADELKTARGTYDNHMADIAELIRPLRNELRGTLTEGGKRLQNVFDSTGILANTNLAGGLYGTLTNPANVWFTLETMDQDLNRWYRVNRYLGAISRITLASFGPSWSAFYAQVPELFLDIGAFGTGIFSSEMRRDMTGFSDMCRPLSECWFDVNAEAEANSMYRRWKVSPAAAAQEFKIENLSADTQKKAREGKGDKIEILHATVPNTDYEPGRFGPRGMSWSSCYIEVEQKHEILEEGYREFPFMCPRWSVAAGEKYGRGQGELALPDMRSLNVAQKSNLTAGEFYAKPPIMGPEEGVVQNTKIIPGRMVYGAMTMQGKQLLAPLNLTNGIPFSAEQVQQLRDAVKDAFFFSIMTLVGRTGMTATEVLEKMEEKMRLMGPFTGRVTTEFLDRLVVRRVSMLMRARPSPFPPPPPELQNMPIQVAFVSPMAQAQKSQQAAGVLRTFAFVQAQAAIDPEAADVWDADAATKIVAEAYSAPAGVLRAPELVEERRSLRRQAQLAQAGVAAARELAGAAKDSAAAQAVTGGATQEPRAA